MSDKIRWTQCHKKTLRALSFDTELLSCAVQGRRRGAEARPAAGARVDAAVGPERRAPARLGRPMHAASVGSDHGSRGAQEARERARTRAFLGIAKNVILKCSTSAWTQGTQPEPLTTHSLSCAPPAAPFTSQRGGSAIDELRARRRGHGPSMHSLRPASRPPTTSAVAREVKRSTRCLLIITN